MVYGLQNEEYWSARVLVYGLQNEEYFIWSALNDSKREGEVAKVKWVGG